jgi:hypothetical protein
MKLPSSPHSVTAFAISIVRPSIRRTTVKTQEGLLWGLYPMVRFSFNLFTLRPRNVKLCFNVGVRLK